MAEDDTDRNIDDLLRSLGATDEQIDIARRDGHLVGMAADLVLTKDDVLSAVDLAAQAEVPVEVVLSLWRTLGVAVPDEQLPMFSDRDAEFTSFILRTNPVGSHGDELLRVLGSSLTRVAEAAVAVYVQTVEPELEQAEVDLTVVANKMANVTATALRLGDSMGTIFSHHMRDAILRQRAAQTGVTDRSLHRLAVGFIDLVGFTPLSLRSSPAKLLGLISQFEAKAFDVASGHSGRIVKHIGDEVMFVALDAGAGCAIARDITAAYSEGIEPRGGVAYGDVITRHGDYYGTVVNLASRLAELAVPGEVLVDGAVASSATGRYAFRPAGRRLLKGFDDPIEVFSLDMVPAGSAGSAGSVGSAAPATSATSATSAASADRSDPPG
ncbi:MAG: adenylate/guanylate cyclase domain-containing protein [Acidimicrobiales bacterium]